jgi:diaminohydroxyphosphoribosylaminopyrimidine deaminase/5-amino-6-(5-phosphoribosylamino)uracil reductase
MTNVLVESGPGLLGRLVRAGLIDAALVFVAPLVLGDEKALPPADGGDVPRLADALRLEFRAVRRVGDDALLALRRRA